MNLSINISVCLILILLFTIIEIFLFIALVSVTKPILRYIAGRTVIKATERLLSDKYTQSLSELWTSTKRLSVLNTIETNLRAENGQAVTRPFGSSKNFAGFDNLMFSPPQMTRLSLTEDTPIKVQVTIGPKAEKPLVISIPLMIAGMAYGIALSEESKRALARAARRLQTTTGSGEGPFLPEERSEADKYILQISRWAWGCRNNEQIAGADMLEVQTGQGADIGSVCLPAVEFQGRAQVLSGLSPGKPAISFPAPPGIHSTQDWPVFMKSLRQKANGIPIALKFMATNNLEAELRAAIDLGFDAVTIDGAQGGAHGTSVIKADDFGIPSLNALVRADRFLRSQGVRDQLSLIVCGGYFTPGQCLKALALGADAIKLGTVPVFAMVHNQLKKQKVWEPPTTLVFYDSPDKHKLDIEMAATSVVNTITSMVLEIEEAMRALGRASLKELSPDDLVALDNYSAEVTGVKRVW